MMRSGAVRRPGALRLSGAVRRSGALRLRRCRRLSTVPVQYNQSPVVVDVEG